VKSRNSEIKRHTVRKPALTYAISVALPAMSFSYLGVFSTVEESEELTSTSRRSPGDNFSGAFLVENHVSCERAIVEVFPPTYRYGVSQKRSGGVISNRS